MSTKIEWTDKTWNPITGCTKISAGCEHCYAENLSKRLKAMNMKKYINGFNLTLHDKALEEPLKWKKPQNIFVCSMSDLFHKDVPDSFIDKVFETIIQTPQHKYQILTKRVKRMASYFMTHKVPNNVWIGATVESKSSKDRIDILREIDAPIRFISCEPLLEDLENLNLKGIHWVIVGGESGSQARLMKEEWVLNIKKQAEHYNCAFFFKQWGTWGQDGVKRNKHINGKLLEGKIIQQMPNIE
jgi:protein gp37